MSTYPAEPVEPSNRKRRLRLVIAGVAFAIFIGFCIVPCIFFGGIAAVEQFFGAGDGVDHSTDDRPAEDQEAPPPSQPPLPPTAPPD